VVREKTKPVKAGFKIESPRILALRVLFVLQNSQGHLQDLRLTLLNNQVESLSNTTTSFLQPLNQRIITTSQCCYIFHTFHSISDANEIENFVSASECWKSKSIADCIVNVNKPWTS
jgi:hypothetical protein